MAQLYSIERDQVAATPASTIRVCGVLAIPVDDMIRSVLAHETRCSRICSWAEYLTNEGFPTEALLAWEGADKVNVRSYAGRYAGRIFQGRGRAYYCSGDYIAATRWYERMLAAARHDPRSRRTAVAYYNYGRALVASGHPYRAIDQYRAALRIFRQLGAVYEIGIVHFAAALLLLDAKQYEEALRSFKSAAYCHRGRPEFFEAELGVGVAALGMGRLSDAELALGRARNAAQDPVDVARCTKYLAVAARRRNRLPRAMRLIGETLDLLNGPDVPPGVRQSALLEAAVVAGLMGQAAAAARHLRQVCQYGSLADVNDATTAQILWLALGRDTDMPRPTMPTVMSDDYTARGEAAVAAAALLLTMRNRQVEPPRPSSENG